jgi:glycosyltransferase involved in cell wall biosynthesis
MTESALRDAAGRFSWKVIARQFEKLFIEVSSV